MYREIYVQGTELDGLNGSYHPYGNKRLRPIQVTPKGDQKYLVSNHNSSIEICDRDAFTINEKEKIYRKAWSYAFRNPFQRVVANSTIPLFLLKLQTTLPKDDYAVKYPFSVTSFSYRLGEKQFNSGKVGAEWEILIISKDATEEFERYKYFNKIIVRPSAGSQCAAWLEEKVASTGYIIQNSGMFAYYD